MISFSLVFCLPASGLQTHRKSLKSKLSLVCPIASARSARVFDIPMNILAGLVVLVAVLVTLPFESVQGMSRVSGVILLLVFCLFMAHSVKRAEAEPDSADNIKPMPLAKSLIYIVLGLAGLVLGGEMIVRGSVRVATGLGGIMATLGAVLVWLGCISNRQHRLQRWHGAILLIVYAAYLTYRLINI